MPYLLVIAATFGVMFLLDKGLSKLLRSRTQHRSGTAVRLKKHFGTATALPSRMACSSIGTVRTSWL